MNEADVRREIFHLLHAQHGYWPLTQTDAVPCPRCHTLVKPPIGRPDILVLNPTGLTVVVEVKVVKGKSFSMDNIRPEQRKWLNRWQDDNGKGYLAIGTLVPYHRRLWIIDWDYYTQAERLVRPIQKSIPLVAGKGYRRELQENNLDFEHLFVDYELEKVPGSWELPSWHSLRRIDAYSVRIERTETRSASD